MSHNTLLHHLVRPVVRRIAPSGVTPNQLTTARLFAGFGAALCFGLGKMLWADIGGLMFVLSMLLDRADGELARQTGKSSPFGYRYDIISDCLVDLLTFIGIGIGVGAIAGFAWLGPVVGAFVGGMVVFLFWQLYVQKSVDLKGLSFLNGRFTIDADDAMIMVPILVWLGLSRQTLVVAAIVAPVTAIYFAVTARAVPARQS